MSKTPIFWPEGFVALLTAPMRERDAALPPPPSHTVLQRFERILVGEDPMDVVRRLARELVATADPFLRLVLRDVITDQFVVLRTGVDDDGHVIAIALVPGNRLRSLLGLPLLSAGLKSYLKEEGWASPSTTASPWWSADLVEGADESVIEMLLFADEVGLWEQLGEFIGVGGELWDCVDVVRYSAQHGFRGAFLVGMAYGYGVLEMAGVDPEDLPGPSISNG